MAQRSQYFDSVDEDRVYGSVDFARHLKSLSSDGYILDFENELEVSPVSPADMFIEVDLGGAWVDGRYFEVYVEEETLEIPTANPDNPRIDRVVVRRDLDQREAFLDIITGDPAVEPQPPELTRDTTVWEISLAQIFVDAGTTSITEEDITDERLDKNVCGVSRHSGFEDITPEPIFGEVVDTTGQNDVGGTTTTVEFDTVIYDTADMWDDEFPTRLRIPSDGLYLVVLEIGIDGIIITDGSEIVARFRINPTMGVVADQEFPYINHSGGTQSYSSQIGNLSQIYYFEEGTLVRGQVSLFGFSSSTNLAGARLKVVNLLEVSL